VMTYGIANLFFELKIETNLKRKLFFSLVVIASIVGAIQGSMITKLAT
jgi:hypothetical protein